MLTLRSLTAGLILIIAQSTYALAEDARDTVREEQNRALVLEFFDTVFNKHDVAEGAKILAEDYIQHSPHSPNGKAPFVERFGKMFKDHPQAKVQVVRSASDGDLVWLQVHATANPDDKGQAVLEIFRVKDGMIVEHWGIVQAVPDVSANKNTMF